MKRNLLSKSKHSLKWVCLSVFFCITNLYVYCDQQTAAQKLAGFVQNMQEFNILYPQEKVYLHFDNTSYFRDEIMWFKAYVVIADQNRLTSLSRVLYVELLDSSGNIIETKKLKVENDEAHGEFYLNKLDYSGYYEVRAYTKLMLNWDDAYIFSRVFPVYDPPAKGGDYSKRKISVRPRSMKIPDMREKEQKLKKLNMTFYPEGGNLIRDISSKVAFKIEDENGRFVSLNGSVYDENGERVTDFNTVHNGMGLFSIVPSSDKYTARMTYKGKEYTFDLPAVESGGYVMNVDNLRDDFVYVHVQKSKDEILQELGLTFSCQGRVYVFETLQVSNSDGHLLKIPRVNFPTGVIQATLFTSEGEVMAERLFFVNQDDQLTIQVKGLKEKYNQFQEIPLVFKVNDSFGNPVETNFSLAVRKSESQMETWQDNAQSNLLLSSDLKGFIENAEYYFTEPDVAKRNYAADLLMMVQGWRRYEWKQLAGLEPFEIRHFIEKGIVIDGQVLSVFRKKKKQDIDVTMWMYSDDGYSQRGTCPTDENGRFNFLPEDFYGTWHLSLQTSEKGKRKENRVLLDRVFSPPARSYTFFDKNLPVSEKWKSDKAIETIIESDSLNLPLFLDEEQLLPEITVTEKTKWDEIRHANIVYDIPQYLDEIEDQGKNYTESITEFLYDTNPYFSYQNDILYYKGKAVAFYIDGSSLYESRWKHIDEILLRDVETLSVHERPRMDSRTGSVDYVSVSIRIKKNWQDKLQKGIRQTRLTGYSQPRDFYSPKYQNATVPVLEDIRRTLYWNPNVKTDEMGKAEVVFYNNGSASNLNISAETVTADGKIGVLLIE